MAIVQGVQESGGSASITQTMTRDGEANVKTRTVEELLNENNQLLRRICFLLGELARDELGDDELTDDDLADDEELLELS